MSSASEREPETMTPDPRWSYATASDDPLASDWWSSRGLIYRSGPTRKAGGRGWALFSPDGHYRYLLGRWWGDSRPAAQDTPLLVMLNPSGADHEWDDPTIRRIWDFTSRWGYRAFEVANLCAYRTSDPRVLFAQPDPQGQANRALLDLLLDFASDGRTLIAAWGAASHARAQEIQADLLARHPGLPWQCLGTSQSGSPLHPLRLARDTELRPWP